MIYFTLLTIKFSNLQRNVVNFVFELFQLIFQVILARKLCLKVCENWFLVVDLHLQIFSNLVKTFDWFFKIDYSVFAFRHSVFKVVKEFHLSKRDQRWFRLSFFWDHMYLFDFGLHFKDLLICSFKTFLKSLNFIWKIYYNRLFRLFHERLLDQIFTRTMVLLYSHLPFFFINSSFKYL